MRTSLVAGVLGLAMAAGGGTLQAAGTVQVDAAAPQFTLNDAQGNAHSLSEYRGKFVVLEWVNYDCPFVHKHYGSGNMQRLQSKFRAKGVVWLSICSSAPGRQGFFEGSALAERMAREKADPTAYLEDPEGKVGMLYGAKNTPDMFIINPEGTVIYAGGIDNTPSTNVADIATATNYVEQGLDQALAGQPLSVKLSRPYGCSVKYP